MAFDYRAKNNAVDWLVSSNKGEATLTTQEAIDAFELYTWFIQNYDNFQEQGINVQMDVINEIVPGYIKDIRIGSIYDQTNQENKSEVIQDEEQ